LAAWAAVIAEKFRQPLSLLFGFQIIIIIIICLARCRFLYNFLGAACCWV